MYTQYMYNVCTIYFYIERYIQPPFSAPSRPERESVCVCVCYSVSHIRTHSTCMHVYTYVQYICV